jgi:hypothetical protein
VPRPRRISIEENPHILALTRNESEFLPRKQINVTKLVSMNSNESLDQIKPVKMEVSKTSFNSPRY